MERYYVSSKDNGRDGSGLKCFMSSRNASQAHIIITVICFSSYLFVRLAVFSECINFMHSFSLVYLLFASYFIGYSSAFFLVFRSQQFLFGVSSFLFYYFTSFAFVLLRKCSGISFFIISFLFWPFFFLGIVQEFAFL